MKYIYNHPKTRIALEEWAAEKDLVTAGFFFWSAGTSMQKSQQGLLQSLLMCVLKQRPALTPHLCPDRWNARLKSNERESWTRNELLDTLASLKTQCLGSAKVCFFIDGLDEYEGEMRDLLSLIKDLTTSGSIKICVASRPWIVFKDFWGDNGGKTITLQDLNRNDIRLFAQKQLTEKIHNGRSLVTKAELSTLIDEIAKRSSGVFLWVFLVVRSLLRGITNLDTIKELWTRLRELPVELEEFFKRILDRGERVYRKQRARLFIIQLNVVDTNLSAHDIAHFAEEDPLFALRDDVASKHVVKVKVLKKITQTRVLARCQDLLEFSDTSRLQFLHRTVKDFLETGNIRDQLTEVVGEDFNAHLFICNSMVVQIKAIAQHLVTTELNTIILLGDWSKKYLLGAFNWVSDVMDCFWRHARTLAKDGHVSFGLLAAIDEASYSLHKFYQRRKSDLSDHDCIEIQCFNREDCHEGWLADQVVDRGVAQILFLLIGKTMQPMLRKGAPQRSPLEMAVMHMRSDKRAATIEDLLRRGADPNEKIGENKTIWGSYLDQLSIILDSNYKKLQVINAFLLYGADTSLLFDQKSEKYIAFSELASIVSTSEHYMGFTELPALRSLAKWSTLPTRPKRALDDAVEEGEPSKRRIESPSTNLKN